VPKPYRVLVTGSRDWDDERAVWQALATTILSNAPADAPVVVVHGACPRGADALAAAWIRRTRADGRRPVEEERHPAQWRVGGVVDRGAGPRRNAEMVALGADVCLAFIRNGSRGASHTARLAEEAGIPVRRWNS
jgi:hypothetical protein